MTKVETISWIFLATAMASEVEPANFDEISMIADGINHAVPTQKELQISVSWLINKNLLLKAESKYSLTQTGQNLYNRCCDNATFVSQIWTNLEKEVENLM